MATVIGKQVGSMSDLKTTLKKKSGGGPGWIKYVPKDGAITLRFLTEPDEFLMYEECWREKTGPRGSFPFVDGLVMGKDFDRKSTVFLAQALDVDNDRVIAFQVKQSVLTTLVIKYEKYGTLMDRDYEIAKYGSGLDTTYDVSPESPQNRNVAKYDPLDLQAILLNAYNEAMGVVSDDTDSAPAIRESDKPAGSARRKRPTPPPVDNADPLDRQQMEAMPWAELKTYAKDNGVTLRTTKRRELIDAILAERF